MLLNFLVLCFTQLIGQQIFFFWFEGILQVMQYQTGIFVLLNQCYYTESIDSLKFLRRMAQFTPLPPI